MASLTQKYQKEKLFGQIYTPAFIVDKILNDIGYNSADIAGKELLDPACGDGRFLSRVAERIVKCLPKEDVKQNLEKIEGWDIDEDAIEQCRKNLDKIAVRNNIKVNWNISVKNSLHEIGKSKQKKFDYIVGNPPYIRIQHLEIGQRNYIQQNYKCCQKGSTDIYIAFFELCNKLMKKKGICGLITPNTWLYTETAKMLRQLFYTKKNVKQITNYGDLQVFENATTYSAITIFTKNSYKSLMFQKAKSIQKFDSKEIPYSSLGKDQIWRLSVNNNFTENTRLLKDICSIHVGITTLMDKAYIFDAENMSEDANYITLNTEFAGRQKFEREILKPIIKASKLKNNKNIDYKYVLFPYKHINGKATIIDEKELKTLYPLAYNYLLSIKEKLALRDNGKPVKPFWYAFGRSQGLSSSFGEKILFSPMNKRPNFVHIENIETTFYSGYCIKYNGNYKELLKKLNSKSMEEFIAISGRDFRGGWKAYSKKVIENFPV